MNFHFVFFEVIAFMAVIYYLVSKYSKKLYQKRNKEIAEALLDSIKDLSPLSLCRKCCHYWNTDEGFKCDAFPNGIPYSILIGDSDHHEKHPSQDNDIIFEQLEPKKHLKED